MNVDVELDRDTWSAIVKFAMTISIAAVLGALVLSAAGDVPHAAIVLAVIVVAFSCSWIRTGRVQRQHATVQLGHRRQHV
jgi:hypothetical protein